MPRSTGISNSYVQKIDRNVTGRQKISIFKQIQAEFDSMNPTRRRFLRSSLALAGAGLLPPAMLGSCIFRDESKLTEIDYIGNQNGFDVYREYLGSIKKTRIHLSTLESSLASESGMVILDTVSATKPAYIVMLLEQGKDILTCYPLGFNLGDYANI
jgi:hypothetical protein